MKFNFFTFGGSQFWEDVFYYQKWRIQRHYRSKKYRLLDHWDIKRASGSFEDCRKALVKFIDVYEVPRQSGELVILLHGLCETKNTFKNLMKCLNEKGYNVAAVNYPSTRKSMSSHIQQLEFFLNHTEDINRVSFITKGAGSLLLRVLLAQSYGWQEKFKISKVIHVNPINCGSALFELLSQYKIFRLIFGPMLEEGCPAKAQSVSKLSPEIRTGIIFCETWRDKLLKPVVERFKSLPLKTDLNESDFGNESIKIENSFYNVFDNPKVCEACDQFLKNGSFK